MKISNSFHAPARWRCGARNLAVCAASVMVTALGGAGQQAQAAAPSITIDDVTKSEGNSGTTSFTFHILLSNPSTQNVAVRFATVDLTATAGSDYTATAGGRTFLPGQTSKTVTVPVIGDTVIEPNETFKVILSNPNNATIADNQGKGTILNNDPHVLSINNITSGEGDSGTTYFTFSVKLSNASAQTVSVTCATANGTAIAGNDYTARAATISFPPGVTSKTFSVAVRGDNVPESNETFFVNLSNPVNASIVDKQGEGTIFNDDVAAAVSESEDASE
jgi:Calx-beta domain